MTTHATKTGTERYLAKFPAQASQTLGKTELSCSVFGFGAYRIDTHHPDHKTALLDALKSGINLIDTSTNYGNGESETLIGETLQDAFKAQIIQRDALIIISKAGYIQGSNYQNCFLNGTPKYPEIAHFYEGFAHSIHPDFLKDQIQESLKRLQLDCLDCFLIHNPEYQLMWAINQDHQSHEDARFNFIQQLLNAFDMLETLVDEGLIKSYGISSNTFPSSEDDPHHCSLPECLELAKSIKEDHHFSVIQFPFNALEVGAAVIGQDEKQTPLLYLAKEQGLGTLINRPLNAVIDDQLFRLSESELQETQIESPDIALLESIEDDLQQHVNQLFDRAQEAETFMKTCLQFSHLIESVHRESSFDNWKEWLSYQLIPRTQIGFQILAQKMSSAPHPFIESFSSYIRLIHSYCTGITYHLYAQKHEQIKTLKEIFNQKVNASEQLPLSTLSLALYRSLGVSSILLGMRHPLYVQDASKAAQLAVPENPDSSMWIDIHLQLEKSNLFKHSPH